jgi:hypothetical protein
MAKGNISCEVRMQFQVFVTACSFFKTLNNTYVNSFNTGSTLQVFGF